MSLIGLGGLAAPMNRSVMFCPCVGGVWRPLHGRPNITPSSHACPIFTRSVCSSGWPRPRSAQPRSRGGVDARSHRVRFPRAPHSARRHNRSMICSYVASPLGDLLVVRREAGTDTAGGLAGLYFPTGRHATAARGDWHRDDSAFGDVRQQLDEYFAGVRREFDLPLDPVGTVFQRRVWSALVGDPVRRDHDVREARRRPRRTHGVPSGRLGERAEPDLDHRAVPPGRRRRRLAHRLRRRPRRQTLAADTRNGLTLAGQPVRQIAVQLLLCGFRRPVRQHPARAHEVAGVAVSG